ncbi:MAG TPA: DUF1707 domain-containing protein, partial [Solirubrobacteraceae bacterium]|nr:DUF1707 domain-containing protein [Solirubrobacteraceae bacterium]
MAGTPDLRVSDQDREAAAAELREHYAAGRLDEHEFNERVDAAYAAKTGSELAALRADLPSAGGGRALSPARQGARRRLLHDAGAVAIADGAAVAIWAATSSGGSFWPVWVIIVTALALAYDAWNMLGPNAESLPPG